MPEEEEKDSSGCCEHCRQMRVLFNELDAVLDGIAQRIANLEARRR